MARFPFWLKAVLLAIPGLLLLVSFVFVVVGWYVSRQMGESGGELRPTMAAYDVQHYALDVAVDPENQRISGRNVVSVNVLDETQVFEIDLDDRLDVRTLSVDDRNILFKHHDGLISAKLRTPWQRGERRRIEIVYEGQPKTAMRPPWIDGFVWSETPSGEPWIGVTSEGSGGDTWWPCKDHPSDEPDLGMTIVLTVPQGLVGLSNGRPLGDRHNDDGTVTSEWKVSGPINNYGVTLNIGPYVPLESVYRGVNADRHETIVFWAIPEFLEDSRRLWEQMPKLLEIFGRRFGEYPFFDDKLWVVHAPYLGMEHQTLIAYGGDFTDTAFGFDWVLAHELAHEWWGNKVTASDWGDVWLHEGFSSYAEALVVLDTLGEDRYLDYMHELRGRMTNHAPMVIGPHATSGQAIVPDAYGKGAWVIHMLRYLLGGDALDEILRRFADGKYPGSCRFATTQDFVDLVEEVAGQDLGWFWNRYLHTAALPVWTMARTTAAGTDRVAIAWDDPAFEMPLPVRIGDSIELIAMPGGRTELVIDPQTEVVIDPRREVLSADR